MTDASLLSAAAAARAVACREAGEPAVTIVADVIERVARKAPLHASSAAFRGILLPRLLPFGLLAIWQALSATGIVSTAIVPAPSDIWDAARQLSVRGELQHDILVSLRRVAIGFSVGASVGLLFELFVGLFEPVRDLLDRSLQMIRTIPHLALVPLMILWFGIGEGSSPSFRRCDRSRRWLCWLCPIRGPRFRGHDLWTPVAQQRQNRERSA